MHCSKNLRTILFWMAIACMGIVLKSHALEFSVSDANLQKCLIELSQKNNWTAIESVTKIECHSKEISTIDGLERFTQLQTLSLYNNQISNVSLKKIPNLRHINLA